MIEHVIALYRLVGVIFLGLGPATAGAGGKPSALNGLAILGYGVVAVLCFREAHRLRSSHPKRGIR